MSSTPTHLRFPCARPFRRTALLILALVCAVPVLVRADAASSAPRVVTVAIVRDGPSWLLDDVDASFRQEARLLTAGRAELQFREGGDFDAGWRDGDAACALDVALADPAIDYVVALGVRATAAAAAPERRLGKPVLGALLQETDLVPLPIGSDGLSRKENFAVVTLPGRATDQLAELRNLVPFASLHVVIDPFLAPDDAALGAWRSRLAQSLGVPVTLVPAGADAAATLAAVDDSAQAVFLFPTVRMDGPNRAALRQGLTARKLPVLAFLGQPEVEAGALAGVLAHPRAALARRLAINLDQLVAGAPASGLPLQVHLPRQLFYNDETAAAIGFAADFNALSAATIVGRFAPAGDRAVTFTGALALALERNSDLRAQQSATVAAREGERAAAGALQPQLAASQAYQEIDRDRAAASGGALARSTHRAGLSLSQSIIDDEALTRRRAARESALAAGRLEEVARLDTALDAGQAYLSLLSAQAALRVAEENFQITQRNLELARLRQRVGTSGPEEGFRFESLAAEQRSDLIAARAQVDRAHVALSRATGVEIATRWAPRDTGLDDPAFAFTTGRVIAFIRDRPRLERFRSFAAAWAAERSPDLRAYDQQVKAQRLAAEQKSRRGYVPKVTASADYGRTLRAEYAGPSLSDQLAAAGLPVSGTAADRDNWTVSVTASIPLFTGGSLTADARRSRAELRQLEYSRDGAREDVMAATQAELYAAESAYAAIALSRRAADLAGRNLAVVQDKYEQGAVSIVTLLDAQNSAFAQRQAAEAAVYTFLSHLLQFQRHLGWIEALATPAEKDAWFAEMERAVNR